MNYMPYHDFLYYCESRKLSPKTIKSYRNMNLAFLRYCDNVLGIEAVEEIQKTDIQKYLRSKVDEDAKIKYVNSILRTVRALFVFLMEEEYIRKNPCVKIRFLKEDQTVMEVYTDDEVKQLLKAYDMSDYLSARNKFMISLQIDTGIRCTETILITMNDIYDDRIVINGKGNKQRLVPISPAIYKMLRRYKVIKANYFFGKEVPDNLFLSRTGRPLTVEAIEWVYKKAKKLCDINFKVRVSPHTSRHYFACKSIDSNDLYTVSKLLGHSNISITQVYLSSLTNAKLIDRGKIVSPLTALK